MRRGISNQELLVASLLLVLYGNLRDRLTSAVATPQQKDLYEQRQRNISRAAITYLELRVKHGFTRSDFVSIHELRLAIHGFSIHSGTFLPVSVRLTGLGLAPRNVPCIRRGSTGLRALELSTGVGSCGTSWVRSATRTVSARHGTGRKRSLLNDRRMWSLVFHRHVGGLGPKVQEINTRRVEEPVVGGTD